MTLSDMMLEVAQNTSAKITLPYSSVPDPKNNATKILTGLNYAYKKIAKERYNLETTENVTLDSNKSFNVNSLSKELHKIKSLTYNGYEVTWLDGETIVCPYNNLGDVLQITYCYVPADLTFSNMNEEPLVKCDHKILCYYASFQYLMGNGQDTHNWLDLFNDGFDNIRQNRGKSRRVRGS